MNKLSNYLSSNNIDVLNEEIIVSFVKDTYNFDYHVFFNVSLIFSCYYFFNYYRNVF